MLQFSLGARGVVLGTTMALAGLGGLATAAEAAPPDRPTFESRHQFQRQQARLGIVPLKISPELRKHLGAPSDRGVLVDEVAPDSPAARAKIRVGDIIISVDGADVTSRSEIVEALSDRKDGDMVTVLLVRDRVQMPVMVKVDEAMVASRRHHSKAFRELLPFPGEWMEPDGDGRYRFHVERLDLDGLDRLDELRDQVEALRERIERLERK